MTQSFYDFTVKAIDGTPTPLAAFKGKALLVVNVASKCGLTPQYKGLENLYQKYKDRGLVILGFPANQFAEQEPGTDQEIQSFCSMTYGVSFPMFAKISVKGEGQDPLYTYLTHGFPKAQHLPGGALVERLKSSGRPYGEAPDILWNFEKFLIGKEGTILARFSPEYAPDNADLIAAIEAALG